MHGTDEATGWLLTDSHDVWGKRGFRKCLVLSRLLVDGLERGMGMGMSTRTDGGGWVELPQINKNWFGTERVRAEA